MDLQKRLHDAINRGQNKEAKKPTVGDTQLTAEQLKNLHNNFRLELSSYIETVIAQIVEQLPGFNSETLFGDKGWGAAIFRDDLVLNRTVRKNEYSRFEIFVRPMSDYYVVDLATKATIRNREAWNRNHFKPIVEAEMQALTEQINIWAVQFVEQYTASDS